MSSGSPRMSESTMLNTCAGAHSWANLPPFTAEEALAQGVDPRYRPAGQQLPGHIRQFLRRYQRFFQTGPNPARYQKQHRVLLGQILYQINGGLRAPKSCFSSGTGWPPPRSQSWQWALWLWPYLGHHHAGLDALTQQLGGCRPSATPPCPRPPAAPAPGQSCALPGPFTAWSGSAATMAACHDPVCTRKGHLCFLTSIHLWVWKLYTMVRLIHC